MKRIIGLLLLVSTTSLADMPLRPEFSPLAFVVGNCWEGDYDGRGTIDRHCFAPMFDGAHIRDTHRLIGGKHNYRGETIYSWNGKEIQFVYWNSLGGVSYGSVRQQSNRIVFPDETYTGANGSLVTVQTVWIPDGDAAYDSVTTERHEDGRVRERRVRYSRSTHTPESAARQK